MPIDFVKLPKEKQPLARIIDLHAERERARLTYRRTMWLLAWYYINGARRFDVFDPTSGLIQPHFLDEEGNMEFQSQELLSAIDRVSGRLSAIDVRPKISTQGNSLAAMRDRSLAQIIADAMTSEDQLKTAKKQFVHIFTTLGCAGIVNHVIDHPVMGLTADHEVIHPTELYPFPSLTQDYTKERGLMRERVVSVDYLKERYGRRISDNLKNMEWWENVAGEPYVDTDGYDVRRSGAFAYDARSGSAGGSSPERGVAIGFAKIRELWLYGPRETCTRYIISSGDYIIEDHDFEGLEVYCPIGVARFIESSTFHGLGLFDLLFSLSRQLEMMMKSLFNNIRDSDRYGILVLPQGEFNERAALRDVGRDLRVLTWEPDPTRTSSPPATVIQPTNLGDVPGKIAGFAKEMLNALNPVQDLIQEKGRVDSAAGLAFLDEQVNRYLASSVQSLERAFSTAHRAMLRSGSQYLSSSPQPMPVSRLTMDMAGAVLDPQTMEVTFGTNGNPLPTLSHLSTGIRERHPRSEVARKQEAIQLLQMETTDPESLKLLGVDEGLDFAMWSKDVENAYQSIVRTILILYGDGNEPGEVMLTPHLVKPEIQLRVLEVFLSSPYMLVASPPVVDAFQELKMFLMESLGLSLPEAVPNPDEAALLGAAPAPAALPPSPSMAGVQ